MSDPSKERLDVLDESWSVVGVAERGVVHRDGLRHRAVHVILLDRQGRMLLQMRSSTKDTCPGMWDTSVGGHVGAGEPLLESALREAREELGIALAPEAMTPAGMHEVPLPGDHEIVTNWIAVHEGPFHPDPVEVERVAWFRADQIAAMVERGECTPNFSIQWRAWLSARLVGIP